MTHSTTIVTLLCVLGISLGQVLFKKAALSLADTNELMNWISNSWLLAAIILYGVTTVVWIWVLRQAPLHLAYPFMALAFILVPLLAKLLLNEPIHAQTFVGGTLILVGITITAHAW
ncbi:hypothetical protein [Comamonas sp. NLF-1-9]|uniref:hypothetical protein n=1 Tax=Comamonas sp. NLF-1-9 TaxID=2853163 RepID=UPI001C458860|nr:hypothetical protein [Comamonas sp. NLF-1-9]QXL84442.1 hypothetical protein KUD94_00095 [Comamonas sp. NLF-1-9]